MNYIRLDRESVADAPGISVTLFVSGCKANKVGSMNCPGCHNPEAQRFASGKSFGKEALDEITSALSKSWISNFVLCGGEPLDQDLSEIESLVKKVRSSFPSKKIWLYTGYEWDKIKEYRLLSLIDVAVVGPFILAQRDISNANPWRGSRNQRVLDVKKSLEADKPIPLEGILNNEIPE